MGSHPHSLIAIDPGLNSMGVAIWSGERVGKKRDVPSRTFLLKAPRKLELAPRALWLARQLEKEIKVSGERCGAHHSNTCGCFLRYPSAPFDIVSEFPAWHGIQLGWAAGDLQKLCFLVGLIAGYFKHASEFTPVTPGEWKGQLPKDVVIRRITKRFGPGATREYEKDIWDAVGIGLWKLGRF